MDEGLAPAGAGALAHSTEKGNAMTIVSLSVTHRIAPVDAVERLAVPHTDLRDELVGCMLCRPSTK